MCHTYFSRCVYKHYLARLWESSTIINILSVNCHPSIRGVSIGTTVLLNGFSPSSHVVCVFAARLHRAMKKLATNGRGLLPSRGAQKSVIARGTDVTWDEKKLATIKQAIGSASSGRDQEYKTKRELLRALRPDLRAAIKRGVSMAELAQIITEAGVPMSVPTLYRHFEMQPPAATPTPPLPPAASPPVKPKAAAVKVATKPAKSVKDTPSTTTKVGSERPAHESRPPRVAQFQVRKDRDDL